LIPKFFYDEDYEIFLMDDKDFSLFRREKEQFSMKEI
jgi:hypothetical protein